MRTVKLEEQGNLSLTTSSPNVKEIKSMWVMRGQFVLAHGTTAASQSAVCTSMHLPFLPSSLRFTAGIPLPGQPLLPPSGFKPLAEPCSGQNMEDACSP